MAEDQHVPESASGPSAGELKKKKRKKRLIIALSSVGILLVLFVASVELTSTSRFCSACHYMKPFYQSWQASSHHAIECKVCHYPPGILNTLRAKMEGLVMVGRYWTKLYLKSKPWAEIQDESCLQSGCHDRRLLEGQVKFKTVVFDHKAHFADLKRGKQLRCTTCHSQIVQGEHITVTESSCFICHFKKSDVTPQAANCAYCHTKEQLTAAAVRYNHAAVFEKSFACDKCHSQIVTGDGEVPRENCYKCHFEKDRLEKYGETTLIHQTHITKNKIECTQCHLAIQHKIVKDVEAIADCRTCHTGSHQAQKILYTGTGGKGVDHPMPNIMLQKGLSCKGCHMFHEETGGQIIKSQTSVSRDQACESCHGSGFSRILKMWEDSTRTKLTAMAAIYERARQEVRAGRADARKAAEDLLAEAAFNIDIVDRGKSVHNIGYAQELLHAALDKIEDALKRAGSTFTPDRSSFPEAKAPNACLTCHSGIEEISAPAYGLTFPHKPHVVGKGLDCAACHSNAKKHGELTAPKSFCASCHHQPPVKDCVPCHSLQNTIYQGGTWGDQKIDKDQMAEAETPCTACHVTKKGQVVRPAAAACVECHGKDYDQTFDAWRQAARATAEELRAAIRTLNRAGLTDDQKAIVQSAEKILGIFDQDGSLSIHNHKFLDGALTNILNKIKSWAKATNHE